MKDPRELRTLIAEIELVLARLQKIGAEISTHSQEAETKGVDKNLAVLAGYALHNYYTGLEDVFRRVAETFENEIPSDRWHAGLLQRMALEIPGVRPAVISGELFERLDDLRGFRHFFRHSYGREIDPRKLQLLLERFLETSATSAEEVKKLLEYLHSLVKELEES